VDLWYNGIMSEIKITITDSRNPSLEGGIYVRNNPSLNSVLSVMDFVSEAIDKPAPSSSIADLGNLLTAIDEVFTVAVDDSSFVESIGYNFSSRKLVVSLETGEYTYQNVPVDLFLQFIAADSKGEFYNANIKGRFNYRRL
jgi:hypothetical protein